MQSRMFGEKTYKETFSQSNYLLSSFKVSFNALIRALTLLFQSTEQRGLIVTETLKHGTLISMDISKESAY